MNDTFKFEDIADIKGRIGWKGLKVSEYINTGYPIVGGLQLNNGNVEWDKCSCINKERYDESPEIKIKENDILISKDGTIGKLGFVKNLPKEATVATGVFILRVKDERFIPEYVYYYLNSNKFKTLVKQKITGSVIPHLYQRDINKLTIKRVDLNRQKFIINKLRTIDDKISNNLNIVKKFEEYLSLIYYKLFIKYDFQDGKLKSYNKNNIKMKKINGFDIPEKWNLVKLDDLVEEIIDNRGKTPKKLGGDWVEQGITAISAKNIKEGKLINLDKCNKVSESMYKKWMPITLQKEDIIMTSEAPLGEFYFMGKDSQYCLSQRLYAIRAKRNIIYPSYLYCEMSMQRGLKQILGKQSGSTVFGIRQNELRKIMIVLPERDIQEKFNAIATSIFDKIRLLEKENRLLIQLKETLIEREII